MSRCYAYTNNEILAQEDEIDFLHFGASKRLASIQLPVFSAPLGMMTSANFFVWGNLKFEEDPCIKHGNDIVKPQCDKCDA